MAKRKGLRGRNAYLGNLFWFLSTVCLTLFHGDSTAAQLNRPVKERKTVDLIQKAVIATIAKTEKAVVAIGRGRIEEHKDPEKLFVANEFASGFLFEPDGFILTNYHLLGDVDQESYAVWHLGKGPLSAQVVAADPWTDLAVLRIQAKDLPFLSLDHLAEIKKGTFVVGFGNPYAIHDGGTPSATWGIISNIQKKQPPSNQSTSTIYSHGQIFQTDAKLKLGQSGGPVVDLDGKLLGIQTSLQTIAGDNSDGSYAVKIETKLIRVIRDLQQGKKPEFGFLGVNPKQLASNQLKAGMKGIRIGPSNAYKATPAFHHGLEPDDIITHVNDVQIHDSHDLKREISLQPPASVVQISLVRTDPFLRRTRRISRNVKLSKRPPSLFRHGKATVPSPSWRGIQVDYLTTSSDLEQLASKIGSQQGVLITSIVPESPAFEELSKGFLITSVNGSSTNSPNRFFQLANRQKGRVQLEVISRTGEARTLTIDDAVRK